MNQSSHKIISLEMELKVWRGKTDLHSNDPVKRKKVETEIRLREQEIRRLKALSVKDRRNSAYEC